jgi:VanZ family protein
MQKLNNYFETKWLVLTATLTAIVLVLTHIPQELTPSQLQASGLDKLLHAASYGAITLLLVLSVKAFFSLRSALLVLFVLLAVGSVDEITQPLVRRQASFGDLLANAVGILTVLSLSIVCARRLQRLKVESVSRLCFTAAVAFFCRCPGVARDSGFVEHAQRNKPGKGTDSSLFIFLQNHACAV